MTEEAIQRPALYYPYIHVRSEHWLKATLLCVPVVKRIVPDSYLPEDDPRILKYVETIGPYGPLLQAVPAMSEEADKAQHWLLTKLREHAHEIQQRYDRAHAPIPDEYWIHDAKFNQALLQHLLDHDLAWPSSHSRPYGHRSWYALHPVLGSAVMTTLGLSIAREQHYDIVTADGEFHEALLGTDEDGIFDSLLAGRQPNTRPSRSDARRDLAQLVITLTGVNFEALRPEDIPELQSSKKFREFQRLLRSSAQFVDEDLNGDEYRAHLEEEAQHIVSAWRETEGDLSRALRDVLFVVGLKASSDVLSGLAEGSDVKQKLYAAGGMAVALLVREAMKVRRRSQTDPYQYLTEIVQAQHEQLRLTLPLGIEK